MPINCSEFTAYPLKITKFIAVTMNFGTTIILWLRVTK